MASSLKKTTVSCSVKHISYAKEPWWSCHGILKENSCKIWTIYWTSSLVWADKSMSFDV